MKTICIDTETTGLHAEYDDVIQLAIIVENDGIQTEAAYWYIRPRPAIMEAGWAGAQEVNGISPEMVEDCPTITELLPNILPYFVGAERIVGYNTEFDLAFLRNAGIQYGDEVEIVDVMQEFAVIYGDWNDYYQDYKWQKLTTCAAYYKYEWPGDAHDALNDAAATLYCYHKMRKADDGKNED